MGERKWWQRVAAGVCVTGIAVGLAVVGAGTASATVDANQPGVNEPDYNATINGEKATQVLSINYPGTNLVLDVYGGYGSSTSNGEAVQLYPSGTTGGGSDVSKPNQVWEFVPDHSTNHGGTISTGWGSLRGRDSGKCLDIYGGTGAPSTTAVLVWDCHGGVNQQWKTVQNSQGTQIMSRAVSNNSTALYLGLNPTGGCGNHGAYAGIPLMVRDFSMDGCTTWNVNQTSYRFATNPVTDPVDGYATGDSAAYGCLPGYRFPTTTDFDDSISEIRGHFDPADTPKLGVNLYLPSVNSEAHLSYSNPGPAYWAIGQVLLKCQPN